MRPSQFRLLHKIGRQLRHLSTNPSNPRVCVIGSGPAGFYTAKQLLKGNPDLRVDIVDKLPVPFGLVRYGVAPDHPDVKNVINTFTETGLNSRCSFLGNVNVGTDVTLEEMRQAYTAVVFAYGAAEDRKLELPGADLAGVVSARQFVGWYNGLPEDRNLQPDLTSSDTAVVIGVGNVALDVARILLTPLSILKKTDITEYALEALANSKIKTVHIVGRRGPLQVAFTIKELREMTKLPGCRYILEQSDYKGLESVVNSIPRPRKRLTELMISTATKEPTPEEAKRLAQADKAWSMKFLRSPLEFLPNQNGDHVGAVRFGVNELQGDLGEKQSVKLTNKTEDISCGLVLTSIGYKSVPLDSSVPFDEKNFVIENKEGRVTRLKDCYCVGWARRGPVGVILSTMNDGFQCGRIIQEDIDKGVITPSPEHGGADVVLPLLKKRGVQVVTFDDWKKIGAEEEKRGKAVGKPREKITDVQEILDIVSRQ